MKPKKPSTRPDPSTSGKKRKASSNGIDQPTKKARVHGNPNRASRSLTDQAYDDISKKGTGVIKDGGKIVKNSGKKLVQKAGKYFTDKGMDKGLVNAGQKAVIHHGSKLVDKGVGAAKGWLQNDGRKLWDEGVSKVKKGAMELKDKISDKANKFFGRFKKR